MSVHVHHLRFLFLGYFQKTLTCSTSTDHFNLLVVSVLDREWGTPLFDDT